MGCGGEEAVPSLPEGPPNRAQITPAVAPTPPEEGCWNILPGWSHQGRDRHRCAALWASPLDRKRDKPCSPVRRHLSPRPETQSHGQAVALQLLWCWDGPRQAQKDRRLEQRSQAALCRGGCRGRGWQTHSLAQSPQKQGFWEAHLKEQRSASALYPPKSLLKPRAPAPRSPEDLCYCAACTEDAPATLCDRLCTAYPQKPGTRLREA